MATPRTYSGSRIRISDHQAALIVSMIRCTKPAYILPTEHHIRHALTDLHTKVIAQANRHALSTRKNPKTTNPQDSQASIMWATPAVRQQPGINDVGHTAGDMGHNAGMNPNLGQA